MPAIARKHSAVEDALCSGIGAQLMFIDATIMCRNIADLNREGIVALPIHDSVIVQAKSKSAALEIMERNLALQTEALDPQKSTPKSAHDVIENAQEKAPPHLIPHLHNGHSGGGWVEVAGHSGGGWLRWLGFPLVLSILCLPTRLSGTRRSPSLSRG